MKITIKLFMNQKHLVPLNTVKLKKKPLIKQKVEGQTKLAGRNNLGKITVRHKGGGHKRRYRKIDFNRMRNSTGIVCSIEYDPNRNTNIASIYDFGRKEFFYILAPQKLNTGDIVESGNNVEPKLGNALPISEIPISSYIHNISPKKSKQAQLSRAAGTYSKLKEKTLKHAIIELSSGEQRLISLKCYATIGIVSNEFTFLVKKRKAGQSRWLNKRPTVRGVAMNPVDHPHGGGEGKKSGKNKTPWGKTNYRGRTRSLTNKYILKQKSNS